MLQQQRHDIILSILAENGTVTIAHSHTVNLKEVTKRADILVVAIGKRQMIDAEYVKPGAAVIDVGKGRTAYAGTRRRYARKRQRLCDHPRLHHVEHPQDAKR